MSLLRKVVRLQRERNIFPRDCKVLIAFSGGVDSVVLYNALRELSEFLCIREMALAHFNHKLREDSYRDESFCVKFAKRENLKIFIGSHPVRDFAKERGMSLEEAGRLLRYGFFKKVCKEEGYDIVATAHHLNDLAETIIMWLVRGAGLEGLKGFEPKEGNVVRPLYYVKKDEILGFAKERNLEWIEDSTNYIEDFARNRIRHSVMPVLRGINKNLEESILNMRDIIDAENDLLSKLTEEVYSEVIIGGNRIDAKILRGCHVAIQRRVLRKWTGVNSFRKIAQMRRLLYKGGRVYLGGGRFVESKEGVLFMRT